MVHARGAVLRQHRAVDDAGHQPAHHVAGAGAADRAGRRIGLQHASRRRRACARSRACARLQHLARAAIGVVGERGQRRARGFGRVGAVAQAVGHHHGGPVAVQREGPVQAMLSCLGAFDGCEPFDEIAPFLGRSDWTRLDAKTLDIHHSALNFFSEGGFRFFLPAYLIADLREELLTADPLFYLWHGFASVDAELSVGAQIFRRESGAATLLNPNRYCAMRWIDYARYRLSIFTREEAGAIVSYMTYRRARDVSGAEHPRIDTALREFWLDRTENAPSQANLDEHLRAEERFVAALERRREEEK